MKQLQIKTLKDFDFKDQNVFMRVDFNVPFVDGEITDSYRIEKSLPSIRYVLEQGGHLLLASHLDRPGGRVDPRFSLKPVAGYLNEKYGLEVLFVEEPDSFAPKRLLPGLKKHQLILLENLRFHPGEEKRDKAFARHLASYTDIYINEGFGISHREHSSVTLLPELIRNKGLGLQFETEMEKLDLIKEALVKKPFTVILGGSKLKDKIPLMETLIDQADEFLIGGLMAFPFLKALGHSVGDTFVEKNLLSTSSIFMNRLKERGKKLFLPVDHVIEKEGQVLVWDKESLPEKALGRDIGPSTIRLFEQRIREAQTLFWNGPMGFFEKEDFKNGTQSLAQILAQHKKAYRVIGGGHSALAVQGFESEIDHVSTGGGASLSYLQGNLLPGLKSLISEVAFEEEQS